MGLPMHSWLPTALSNAVICIRQDSRQQAVIIYDAFQRGGVGKSLIYKSAWALAVVSLHGLLVAALPLHPWSASAPHLWVHQPLRGPLQWKVERTVHDTLLRQMQNVSGLLPRPEARHVVVRFHVGSCNDGILPPEALLSSTRWFNFDGPGTFTLMRAQAFYRDIPYGGFYGSPDPKYCLCASLCFFGALTFLPTVFSLRFGRWVRKLRQRKRLAAVQTKGCGQACLTSGLPRGRLNYWPLSCIRVLWVACRKTARAHCT